MDNNLEFSDVTAKVKWFNQFRGYGFVTVSSITQDVFVHYSVLSASGVGSLHKNDTILCNICSINGKPHVSHITKILKRDKYDTSNGMTCIVDAIVKWYNPTKGFGFAKTSDSNESSDVFIHSKILKEHGIRSLEPGMKIKLLAHNTNHGIEALDIIT